MSQRPALLIAVLALTAACLDQPTSHLSRPSADFSDGTNGGNTHFFFLPPMVPDPGPGAGNDVTQSPVVEICELGVLEDGSLGCVETLATYTMDLTTTYSSQPGNSETIRLGESHFIVNWHTDAFPLDPALTYRICVKLNEVPLGYADVDVVSSGRDLRVVADGFVGVLDGRTLPIKFRIEPGALDDTGGNCGEQAV